MSDHRGMARAALQASGRSERRTGAQGVLEQHQNQIETLQHENEVLADGLAFVRKTETAGTLKAQRERMLQLSRLIDVFTLKLAAEKRKADEVEGRSIVCAAKIAEVRAAMAEASGERDAAAAAARSLAAVEHRAAVQQRRLDETLAANRRAAGEVEDARRAHEGLRGTHARLHARLEALLADAKQLADQAVLEKDAAGEAAHEAWLLKSQAQKEQLLHEREVEQMDALCAAEQSVHGILMRRAAAPAEAAAAGPPSDGELWAAFDTVAAHTGVLGLPALVRMFVDAQLRNFELFSEVDGINDEIARLRTAKGAAEAESAAIVADPAGGQDRAFIQALSEQRRAALERAQKLLDRHAERERTLKRVQNAAVQVLKKVGYSASRYKELKARAESQGRGRSAVDYLGLMEERLQEIVGQETGCCGHDPDGEPAGVPSAVKSPASGRSGSVPFVLPSSLSEGDGDGDE